MASKSSIQVFSGKVFDPLKPNPDDIVIEDIARALSMQCRFTGHVARRYSVAEHSVTASNLIQRDLAFEMLMHDAAEAYLGDVASPLKSHPEFGRIYRAAEDSLMAVIREKFDMLPEQPDEVTVVDKRMLQTERLLLMGNADDPAIQDLWEPWLKDVVGYDPNQVHVSFCAGWSPELAEVLFLERFKELR